MPRRRHSDVVNKGSEAHLQCYLAYIHIYDGIGLRICVFVEQPWGSKLLW